MQAYLIVSVRQIMFLLLFINLFSISFVSVCIDHILAEECVKKKKNSDDCHLSSSRHRQYQCWDNDSWMEMRGLAHG